MPARRERAEDQRGSEPCAGNRTGIGTAPREHRLGACETTVSERMIGPPDVTPKAAVKGMMTESFVFVVAAVGDLSAADAVIDALTTSARTAVGERLDIVSVGRKASGEVRFHREGSGHPSSGSRWNAAAGLAAVLFPSVGADEPSTRSAERAVLAAVSGRVAAAIGRTGLKEFGELLDTTSAAVIVVTATGRHDAVVESLLDWPLVATRTGELDVPDLDRVAKIVCASVSTHRTDGGRQFVM